MKDYDFEILYHPGKSNMVADAFSHKSVTALIRGICVWMTVITSLLEPIQDAQIKAMKEENQKRECIVVQVASFVYDN